MSEGKDSRADAGVVDRRDRKFAVSTNRGKAGHKVRYVEAGGAGVDIDECTFCEAMPDLSERESGENAESNN